MSDDLTVTIADARKAGFCVRGLKQWAAVNRLDFKAFLRQGFPAARLVEMDDALALKVVAVARKRRADG